MKEDEIGPGDSQVMRLCIIPAEECIFRILRSLVDMTLSPRNKLQDLALVVSDSIAEIKALNPKCLPQDPAIQEALTALQATTEWMMVSAGSLPETSIEGHCTVCGNLRSLKTNPDDPDELACQRCYETFIRKIRQLRAGFHTGLI